MLKRSGRKAEKRQEKSPLQGFLILLPESHEEKAARLRGRNLFQGLGALFGLALPGLVPPLLRGTSSYWLQACVVDFPERVLSRPGTLIHAVMISIS
jgi:hypothetical protein